MVSLPRVTKGYNLSAGVIASNPPQSPDCNMCPFAMTKGQGGGGVNAALGGLNSGKDDITDSTLSYSICVYLRR